MVIDAGNGTGGVVAVPIFKALGFDVVPLFLEPDGNFPNHHPDPTVEKNLEALRRKVLEVGADVGDRLRRRRRPGRGGGREGAGALGRPAR